MTLHSRGEWRRSKNFSGTGLHVQALPCRHLFFSNACASSLSLSCAIDSCRVVSLEINMLPSFSRLFAAGSGPSCLFRNFVTRSCKKPNKQLQKVKFCSF